MVDLTKLSDNQIQQLIQEQQELTKDMSKDPKEIALKQLSVSETMSKTLEQIQQQNIFKFDESQRKTLLETNKGLTMYGKDPTTGKQHDASGNFIFAKEYKELFDKMTQEGKTVIDLSLDAYEKIVEIDKKYIETITNGYTTMVNGLSTLLTKLVNVVSTGTTSVPTIQTNDFFLPSDSKTMITSDFGGMTKKIIPNNDDTLLGMPKESMESLFKYDNFGGEVSTMVPKEKNFDKNVQTLTQYVEQKIVTENTSNVKLGVDPINVNVKLEGTGLSKDEISKLINQNDINDAVVEKLRDLMDPTKLMNSIPKLKI
jgi:hypothetical protein